MKDLSREVTSELVVANSGRIHNQEGDEWVQNESNDILSRIHSYTAKIWTSVLRLMKAKVSDES